MDYESLIRYCGKRVRLTLVNGFWYKAKILSVSPTCISFRELKGNLVSVTLDQIIQIEEVSNGGEE